MTAHTKLSAYRANTTIFSPPPLSVSTKALSAKALAVGGDGENPGLVQWVEENRHLYDAVLSGTSDLSQRDQAQIVEWFRWSFQQLGITGSNWGEEPSWQGRPQGPEPEPLPAGAIAGPHGNLIYDQMDATINHTPDKRPIEIYSNTVVINSPSMMTTFTSEITTDTRLIPPEEVLKITASDGTVYFVHDFQDAKVKIRTPIQHQVTDSTDFEDPERVTWEESTSQTGLVNTRRGWSGGITEETEENHWVHIGNAGETIDFMTQVREDGEVEYHEVHGEANISVRSDSTADITTNAEGDTVVTVKDREGNTVAVYTVKQGFPIQVNHSNEDNLTLHGQPLRKTTDSEGNETFIGLEDLNINGTATVILLPATAEPIENSDDIPEGH